jgi:hypothetical protein
LAKKIKEGGKFLKLVEMQKSVNLSDFSAIFSEYIELFTDFYPNLLKFTFIKHKNNLPFSNQSCVKIFFLPNLNILVKTLKQ